jgi:transposase
LGRGRKAEVVAAVKGGLLTIHEACERYNLSLEELMLWQRSIERSGILGLRVNQIQSIKALQERQDQRSAQDPAAVAEVELTSVGGA